MKFEDYTKDELIKVENDLMSDYKNLMSQKLKLDLTRGKPSAKQLDFADSIDGILNADYISPSGTDTRNYGGLDGLAEMKDFAAEMLNINSSEVLIGGNSSLTLMYQYVSTAFFLGVNPNNSAWQKEGKIKFLCPVPGYDRHFSICEELGIEMINVNMNDEGPDMDQIEDLLKKDPLIKGIWCVPKYSNPTGITFSDSVVERFAKLGKIAGENFRIMWDNAYLAHDITSESTPLANIMTLCKKYGTEDSVIITASTSKITLAGAGVSFLGSSEKNITNFKKRLAIMTIGPDKVNQLRHLKFLKNMDVLKEQMSKLADVLAPKFKIVLKILEEELAGTGIGKWTKPLGGYFISFDSLPDLANKIVKLTGELGVKLTPAGATFPYKKDPNDTNIRIAPSLPPLPELEKATRAFVLCVKLASVRSYLDN